MGENGPVLLARDVLRDAVMETACQEIEWVSCPPSTSVFTLLYRWDLRSLTSFPHDQDKRGNGTSSFPAVFFLKLLIAANVTYHIATTQKGSLLLQRTRRCFKFYSMPLSKS